jgi:hypothetical protein
VSARVDNPASAGDLEALRDALRRLVDGEIDVPVDSAPDLVAALAGAQAAVLLRAARASASAPIAAPAAVQQEPRLLTAAQAAAMLGRSRWWLYKHSCRELPDGTVVGEIPAVFVPGGRRAYSEARLRRWIRDRS